MFDNSNVLIIYNLTFVWALKKDLIIDICIFLNQVQTNSHPKYYTSFSFESRNCLDKTLTKIEAKVVLTRVTTLDYEVEEDLLENNNIRFNLFSQFLIIR